MFHLEISPELELRLLTEGHSQLLFDLIERNRAYLRGWLPWVDGARTLDNTRRLIRASLRQHARNEGMNVGIWYHNQLVGVVSYNYIDHVRRFTELGYWLDEAHQGNGIMTTVCRAMTNDAFGRLKLDRVEIRCAVTNQRSRAIPERLGYTIDGTSAQLDWTSDHYIETVVYSMSATQWQLQEANTAHDSANRRRRQL